MWIVPVSCSADWFSYFNSQHYLANKITIGDEQFSSLIKGVLCGIIKPGAATVKILHLLSRGAAGDRILDISVQTRIPGSSSPDQVSQDDRESDVTENLQTVSVPTVDAFHLTQGVTYQHSKKEWSGLGDFKGYEEDYEDFERGMEATVITDIRVVGPWSIYIERVEFDNGVGQSGFDITIITLY